MTTAWTAPLYPSTRSLRDGPNVLERHVRHAGLDVPDAPDLHPAPRVNCAVRHVRYGCGLDRVGEYIFRGGRSRTRHSRLDEQSLGAQNSISRLVISSTEGSSLQTASMSGTETVLQGSSQLVSLLDTSASNARLDTAAASSIGTQAADGSSYDGNGMTVGIEAKLRPITLVEQSAERYISQACESDRESEGQN